MNVDEIIKETRKSHVVAFHQFVLLTKGNGSDLFCFFEGYDSPYYSLRIRNNIKGNYHPIICGSKKSVIELWRLIRSNPIYSKYKCGFFVDHDFDITIKSSCPGIYETPCYSVENFYVTQYTLIEILKNEFHLMETDQEFQDALKFFNANKDVFHSSTLLFNAWYACLKSKSNELGIKPNVSLDEKLPKDFMILQIGSIQSNYNLERIIKYFPNAIEIKEDEIDTKIKENESKDPSSWQRGKFEIWFFYEFLRYLISDANIPSNRKILKRRTKFSIDKAQILSQLSQYALTPKCLTDYLTALN